MNWSISPAHRNLLPRMRISASRAVEEMAGQVAWARNTAQLSTRPRLPATDFSPEPSRVAAAVGALMVAGDDFGEHRRREARVTKR